MGRLEVCGHPTPYLGVLLLPTYRGTQKAARFGSAQNERRFCDRCRLPCNLLCHLGHMILQIQWYLKWQWQIGMLFEAVGRQAPLGQSQCRPLDFWSTDTYSPFEKLLWACSWAFIQTENLTIGHAATTQPQLSITNWVLSG